MIKTALIFSGQGSQYTGMGKALFNASPAAKKVYECACDILGFDVAKTSFEAPAEELSRTLFSQPVIFTLSMAAFAAIKEKAPDFLPDACAGHSLGEIAALCCAGAYNLEDGFRIVKARASAMEEAASVSAGAMYAIIGSNEEAVAEACAKAGGLAEPVNFNLPNQTVISGEEKAVASAAGILASGGAKAVRLGVSSAFHTKMMQPAADKLKNEISGISFSALGIDFYSNLTGGKHAPANLPEYFASHMVSPVRFIEEIAAMSAAGIGRYAELGPGKAAATLVKKNNRALSVCNVEDPETLEAFLDVL